MGVMRVSTVRGFNQKSLGNRSFVFRPFRGLTWLRVEGLELLTLGKDEATSEVDIGLRMFRNSYISSLIAIGVPAP